MPTDDVPKAAGAPEKTTKFFSDGRTPRHRCHREERSANREFASRHVLSQPLDDNGWTPFRAGQRLTPVANSGGELGRAADKPKPR